MADEVEAVRGRAKVACPSCGVEYRVKPELSGKRFRCKCGGVITAPRGAETQPRAAAAEDWNYDALAGLGTGSEVTEAPPVPPVYSPRVTKPKRERAAGGGGGIGRWLSGGFAAIFSRDAVPKSREQHVVQYWVVGPGFIVLGIVGIIFLRWAAMRYDAFMQRAQQTTGVIAHEPKVTQGGRGTGKLNPRNWRFTFPVAFKVDGRDVQQEVTVGGGQLPPNLDPENTSGWLRQEIPVYYDPANPAEVKAGNVGKTSDMTIGYVVAGAFIAIGAWAAVTRRP